MSAAFRPRDGAIKFLHADWRAFLSRQQVDSLLEIKSFFFLDGCGKLLSFLLSGGDASTVDLRNLRGWNREEFGSVVGLMASEHGVEGVEQFAHDGHQGLHLEFAGGQQVLIEAAEVRIVPHRHQGRHIESMT